MILSPCSSMYKCEVKPSYQAVVGQVTVLFCFFVHPNATLPCRQWADQPPLQVIRFWTCSGVVHPWPCYTNGRLETPNRILHKEIRVPSCSIRQQRRWDVYCTSWILLVCVVLLTIAYHKGFQNGFGCARALGQVFAVGHLSLGGPIHGWDDCLGTQLAYSPPFVVFVLVGHACWRAHFNCSCMYHQFYLTMSSWLH